MMRKDVLAEIGLLPAWRRRPLHAATAVKKSVSAASIPPASPPAITVDDAPATAPPPAQQQSVITVDDAAIATMNWENLAKTVSACEKCPLAKERKKAVFGVGDKSADIFFIGEGPGFEEDRQGEPFVGPAGKLLDEMLKSIGLGRTSGVYISNIVKCRPPNNRNPKPAEASACGVYLRRQLQLVKPRLIVALGGVAAANLLRSEEPVGKLRQRLHDYDGVPLVVTYHPAYLLRAPKEKRKSWDDLRMIRKLSANNP